MRVRHLPVLLCTVLALTIPSATANAQVVPAADVSFGYSFLTDGDINVSMGLYGDVGVSVTDRIQIVWEIAHHRKTIDDFGFDIDFHQTTFLVKPRLLSRGDVATGYVQALVGGANLSGGTSVFDVDVSLSTTAFVLQLGGGVIVPVSDRAGIRFGADYQWGRAEGSSGGQFKVSAGVSFALGAR